MSVCDQDVDWIRVQQDSVLSIMLKTQKSVCWARQSVERCFKTTVEQYSVFVPVMEKSEF